MIIGEKIKMLRTQKNITQETLANHLNVTPQAVSKWENGSAVPDISLFLPIADFFDVSTDYLLRDKPKLPAFDMSYLEITELGRKNYTRHRYIYYTFKNISSLSFKSISLKFLFKNEAGEVIFYDYSHLHDLEPTYSYPITALSRAQSKYHSVEIMVTDFVLAQQTDF